MFRIALVASIVLFGVLQVAAVAQALPDLTVTALSITSERTAAEEGQAFHLTIHLHTKQHDADLSSLVLPDVANLTILGDEKHTTPTPGDGTDYLEVLTVAGIAPGEATVSPAYIDARDPSHGDQPFRFSSNALQLQIRAQAQGELFPWRRWLAKIARAIGAAALGVVALALVGFVVVRARAASRRRQVYVTLPRARPVSQPAACGPIDRAAAVRTAAQRLRRERTRDAAAAVRGALFAFAGARREETLASLLARIPEGQGALRGALRKAERATFVDEGDLQGAIDELLDALPTVSSS